MFNQLHAGRVGTAAAGGHGGAVEESFDGLLGDMLLRTTARPPAAPTPDGVSDGYDDLEGRWRAGQQAAAARGHQSASGALTLSQALDTLSLQDSLDADHQHQQQPHVRSDRRHSLYIYKI